MKRILNLLTLLAIFFGSSAAYADSHNGGRLQKKAEQFKSGNNNTDSEDEDDDDDEDGGSPAAGRGGASADGVTPQMNKLVEEAVSNGVILVRQPYYATDQTGNFYNYKKGKDSANGELGAVYSVGLIINGGYLFTDRVMTPWEYDSEYNEKRNGKVGGVKPETTTYSLLNKKASYQPLAFDGATAGIVYPDKVFTTPVNSALFQYGFDINREEGRRDGYVVWISPALNQDMSKDASLNFEVMPRKISVSSNPKDLINLGTGHANAIGMVYVVPEVNGIGNIVLNLEGIGVFDPETMKWSLAFAFGDEDDIFKPEQLVKPEKKEEAPVANDDVFELIEESNAKGKSAEVKKADAPVVDAPKVETKADPKAAVKDDPKKEVKEEPKAEGGKKTETEAEDESGEDIELLIDAD